MELAKKMIVINESIGVTEHITYQEILKSDWGLDLLAWKADVYDSSLPPSPPTSDPLYTPLFPSPPPHTPNPTLYIATETGSFAFKEKKAVYSSLAMPTPTLHIPN